MTTRKAKTVDVTDYMRKVCAGAGVSWDVAERFVLPVSMWRVMRKVLRLDDWIQEEAQDARPDDTQD